MDQERATPASLRVAWILGKKKRPFTDSETVKECLPASIKEVVTDEKTRKSIMDSIKQIPIFDTSNMRRVESLASDIFESLLDKLRKTEVTELIETMDSVMAIINFIRCTSSLQHRLFRKLLTDISAEYKDLPIHNDMSKETL